jgi:hypothetical protein
MLDMKGKERHSSELDPYGVQAAGFTQRLDDWEIGPVPLLYRHPSINSEE